MKRSLILLFCMIFLFSSCSVSISEEKRCAEDILTDILTEFRISDGFIYHKGENAEHILTDAMLSRMFHGANLADFRYVKSMAVYFSRRFHSREIMVLELYDISHQEALIKLLQKRAEKKENAVILKNGVYVYLICTENHEEIKNFLLA